MSIFLVFGTSELQPWAKDKDELFQTDSRVDDYIESALTKANFSEYSIAKMNGQIISFKAGEP
jgi:ribosomal protein S3